MLLNSRKEQKFQKAAQALRNNLKKRKIFKNKINKERKRIKK